MQYGKCEWPQQSLLIQRVFAIEAKQIPLGKYKIRLLSYYEQKAYC